MFLRTKNTAAFKKCKQGQWQQAETDEDQVAELLLPCEDLSGLGCNTGNGEGCLK